MLFTRLRSACLPEWQAYVGHRFVGLLGDGALPQSSFRRYLGQDYLFLVQFARAYGLAVYKSDAIADIRTAAAGLAAILDETRLHVAFCAEWGVDEGQLAGLAEERATLAYSRFVLDRGAGGDLLDLAVALAPCVIGYAEIGATLAGRTLSDNPYRAWIEAYAGADYQHTAAAAADHLDHLHAVRGGPGREPALIEIFRKATMLETDFWEAAL